MNSKTMIIIAIKYAYQNCEPLSSYHGILISHVNYHTGHDVVTKTNNHVDPNYVYYHRKTST